MIGKQPFTVTFYVLAAYCQCTLNAIVRAEYSISCLKYGRSRGMKEQFMDI